AVRRDLDVSGFQIAMGYALLMRRFERARDLPGVIERGFQWKRSARRFALDEFHHQIVRPDVVKRADVRMIQRSNDSSFTLKPLAELFGGNFDRDFTAEARITGAVHLAHAALSDRGDDFVRTELFSSKAHLRPTGSLKLGSTSSITADRKNKRGCGRRSTC